MNAAVILRSRTLSNRTRIFMRRLHPYTFASSILSSGFLGSPPRPEYEDESSRPGLW